jgi:hypothetical protein
MIQLKNRIFLLTAFMLIGFPLNAQLTLLKSYVINESQVAAVDYIGNYYVQNNNELWMFNRADTVFRKFSIISLSDVTNIDASNALKIQLYYKELGKIIYIDNNVSDFTQSISLNDFDLAQSTLVCASYDNGFWTYLPGTMSLFRYDQNLHRVVNIESIGRFFQLDMMEPTFMKEYSNTLYMFIPDYGLLLFDVFGAYIRTIALRDLVYPDIQSGELIHFKNDTLFFKSLPEINRQSSLALPHHDGLKSVRYSSGKVYMLTNKKLFIYKLQE